MFLHLVLMKYRDGTGAAELAAIEDFCGRVRRECAGLLRYEHVENQATRGRGLDRAIYSTFVSSAAHDAYQVSPAHQAMKAHMSRFIEDLVVCDSEIADTEG